MTEEKLLEIRDSLVKILHDMATEVERDKVTLGNRLAEVVVEIENMTSKKDKGFCYWYKTHPDNTWKGCDNIAYGKYFTQAYYFCPRCGKPIRPN